MLAAAAAEAIAHRHAYLAALSTHLTEVLSLSGLAFPAVEAPLQAIAA